MQKPKQRYLKQRGREGQNTTTKPPHQRPRVSSFLVNLSRNQWIGRFRIPSFVYVHASTSADHYRQPPLLLQARESVLLESPRTMWTSWNIRRRRHHLRQTCSNWRCSHSSPSMLCICFHPNHWEFLTRRYRTHLWFWWWVVVVSWWFLDANVDSRMVCTKHKI